MKNDKKKKKKDKPATIAAPAAENPKPATEHTEEIKRLNRIAGQVDGIRKMLESGRELGDILIQFKAVHSAMRAIEQRVFRNYVGECIEDIITTEKRKDRDAKIEDLLELYRQI